jgi:hypothetical protein
MTSANSVNWLRRVRLVARWWRRPQDRDELFLAAATDLADLERRMRLLERRSAGPPFVTFNH